MLEEIKELIESYHYIWLPLFLTFIFSAVWYFIGSPIKYDKINRPRNEPNTGIDSAKSASIRIMKSKIKRTLFGAGCILFLTAVFEILVFNIIEIWVIFIFMVIIVGIILSIVLYVCYLRIKGAWKNDS